MRDLLLRLAVVSPFAVVAPPAKAMCGFNCGFGKVRELNNRYRDDILDAIDASAMVARMAPFPPAQFYGWSVYAIQQEIETRQAMSKKPAEVGSILITNTVKVVTDIGLDRLAETRWRATGVVERVKRGVVGEIRDYSKNELIEAGREAAMGGGDPDADIDPCDDMSWYLGECEKAADQPAEAEEVAVDECSPAGQAAAYAKKPSGVNYMCPDPIPPSELRRMNATHASDN